MNIAVEIGAYGIRVAIQNNGKVEIVKLGDSLSPYIIPSLAYVAKSGQIILGNLAELSDINNGERVYLSEMMPSDNKAEDIYEKLFAFIKDHIVSFYKQTVSNVTMIVPPYFQSVDPRKKVMREAWMHNGIYNLDFISSDVSTCYRKLNLSNNESALVFDIGYNGTVISVVKRDKNVFRSIANKYINGIGGRVFCNMIYSDMEEQSKIQYDSFAQIIQVQNIDRVSRMIMECLSTKEYVVTSVPFTDYIYSISRKEFNGMINKPLEESLNECLNCIKDSGNSMGEIKKILLTGGCSQIPYIEKILKIFFNTGNSEKKDVITPKCTEDALYAACKGAFTVQQTSILKF